METLAKNYPRPLIIIGAGASHDFVAPGMNARGIAPVSLPLTDGLIKNIDHNISKKYKDVEFLFSSIGPRITIEDPAKRKTLEECLENTSDHDQLCGLRFYLSDYFSSKSNSSDAIEQRSNNYKGLIDLIIKGNANGADVVSFNYDTLFELQLDLEIFKENSDYINKTIRLIKLHGSSDWFWIRRKETSDPFKGIDSAYGFLIAHPEFKPDGPIHTTRMLKAVGQEANDFWHIPALALPTANTKEFICPIEHINTLIKNLNQVERILIIGWRGGDKQLLELIKKELHKPVSIYIVAGTKEGIDEIKQNLKDIPKVSFSGDATGFSNFLADSDLCSKFF